MSRILLIEDDPSTQALLRNRLEDLEHEVVVESTGARGLMEARKGNFDLFLVDVGLGSGIDGYEVCRRLRAMPHFRKVPVVLVSGKVKNREELHKGYEAGCEAYLVKSDVSLLEDVVRAMLRLKALQDDLALQNRMLEDQNRRLQDERKRGEELETALRATSRSDLLLRDRASGGPDGVLVVGPDGIVRTNDRGANDLLGQDLIGRNLGSIAPDTGLEAYVRDASSEPRTGFRLDVGRRTGAAMRTLSITVLPTVRSKAPGGPTPRVVLLFDCSRRPALGAGSGEGGSPVRRELGPLVEAARELYRPSRLVGESQWARDLRARVAELAPKSKPVLLRGETGTGKRLVARVLHYASDRGGPFVPVDCVAITPEAVEEELFGSAKDASARPGLLEQAGFGTLHLREVGRLPRPIQRMLLELLESGEIRRGGEGRPVPLSVRLVASSTEDLDELVAKGRFEPELAARFAGSTLPFVRLKERLEDLPALARSLLERISGGPEEIEVDPAVLEALGRYDWPGNVRELATLLEILVQDRPARITAAQLPSPFVELTAAQPVRELQVAGRIPGAARSRSLPSSWDLTPEEDEPVSLKLYEKRALLRALRECNGDKLAAARLLKIGKSTFYRKLHEHELT